MSQLILICASLLLLFQVQCCEGVDESNDFGVDVSFPMHHSVITETASPFGSSMNKQKFYDDWLNGCHEYFSQKPQACDRFESDRIDMNLNQPSHMMNFTNAGYAKIRIPTTLRNKLLEYWTEQQEQGTKSNENKSKRPEPWPIGNTYTNQWESSTYIVGDIQQYDNGNLAKEVVTAAQDILEAWTGQPLVPTSLYGIRQYERGSVLAPHVDRLPLVTSAILNIAQDLDGGEPWPLEVIGHDGKAHNITMDVGDMVLYESHSIIHGRPYPLEGKYYANLFVHFEPYGYTRRHSAEGRSIVNNDKINNNMKELYKQALERSSRGKIDGDDDGVGTTQKTTKKVLPPHIQTNTLEEKRWNQHFEWNDIEDINKEYKIQLKKPIVKGTRAKTGLNTAHNAAAHGELMLLQTLAEEDPNVLHAIDHNKWTPLHEAARSGETDIIEYLIENGVDVNPKNNNGETPTWWALKEHPPHHPAVLALMRAGGVAESGTEKRGTSSDSTLFSHSSQANEKKEKK